MKWRLLGRIERENKVVEKTAAEAALEIVLRFPLSHNLCRWYHIAVQDTASGRSPDAHEARRRSLTQNHPANAHSHGRILGDHIWPVRR